MIDIAGVRFKSTGKIYYFDPGDLDIEPGKLPEVWNLEQ